MCNSRLLHVVLVFFAFYLEGRCKVFRPRGVSILKAAFYAEGKPFTCFDGSATISFDRVNDDYCDCHDGSDEPGTSACANGYFHCTNVEHVPLDIPSSRVNDGICDCCDGTDEYTTSTQCTNNCKELGQAAREDYQRMVKAMEEGHHIYQQYSQQGNTAKLDNQEKKESLEKELEILQKYKDEMQALKEESEAPEKEAKDKHHAWWEEEKKQREALRDSEQCADAFSDLDTDGDGRVSVEEMQSRKEFDIDSSTEVSEEEAKEVKTYKHQGTTYRFVQNKHEDMRGRHQNASPVLAPYEYLEDNDSVDLEFFTNKVWPNIKAVYKKPASQDSSQQEDQEQVPEEEHELDPDDEHYEDEEADEDEAAEEITNDKVDEVAEGDLQMPEYDDDTKALIEAADKSRENFRQAEDNFNNVDTKLKEIHKLLELDLGPNFEFYPLRGQCYEYSDREYTYKLCPFDRASQRSKSGGSETSLGSWGKWAGADDNKYSVMLYENGQNCWNGPNRSVKVHIECGVNNEVLSAEEPSRCEYSFRFTSPSACSSKPPAHPIDPHTEL